MINASLWQPISQPANEVSCKQQNRKTPRCHWLYGATKQPTNQPRNHPSNDVRHKKKSKIQVKYWWKFLRKSQLEKLVSCFWLLLVAVDVVGWLFVCFFFKTFATQKHTEIVQGCFVYICAYVWMSVCITIY